MSNTAAETARRMETDAVAFYKKAAESVSSPAGKKMFLSIMEDEARHIKMVEDLLKGLGISSGPVNPTERVKTVFSQMQSEMSNKIAASAGDKEALTVAMDMEKAGFEYYQKAAAEAADPKVKELFTRLHAEEVQHYKMFSNTLNFMNDTGNWFLWQEKGIIEG